MFRIITEQGITATLWHLGLTAITWLIVGIAYQPNLLDAVLIYCGIAVIYMGFYDAIYFIKNHLTPD